MPMTLWSVENTYWRQKPRCSCPACSCSASWAGAVSSVAMALPESLSVTRSFVRSLGRRREREVGGGGLGGGDGHLHGLGPQLLVPGLDLVGARRQPRDLVLAVRARDREEGVGEDAGVGGHPAVDVALEQER